MKIKVQKNTKRKKQIKELYVKVYKLLKPYQRQEVLGIILTFLFAVAIFLVPKASEYLIDEVIMAGSMEDLGFGIVCFIAVCFMQPIFGYTKDMLFSRITENITYDIREELFKKIIHADFTFFDSIKSGELISIIMNDGRGASDFISKIFASLLKNIVLILMIVMGMVLISPKITVVVMLCFILFYLVSMRLSKRLRNISRNIQENYDAICCHVNQTNQAIMSIKTYNQQENILKKYEKIIEKMRKDNIKINSIQILQNNISLAIVFICLAIIYGWGTVLVVQKNLSAGEIIALGLYFQLLEQPFFELLNIGFNTNVIIPIFERLDGYKKLEQEKIGVLNKEELSGKIRISDLKFSYNDSKEQVLKGVNITFPKTGFVNVMGESGSGKSTFIKVLMGLYRIEDNQIFYGTKDINDISLMTLRNNISYVPQEVEIMNDSIYNNICYGKENVPYEKVESVCKMLKLHEKIMSLENGYDSIITERVNLSGGEKHRILIARGIIKDASIMILDEPYSALDEENIVIVSNILAKLSLDKLIIMVTHYECSQIIPDMKLTMKNGMFKEEVRI